MLLQHIHKEQKYLLAVSGGIDSMVMCDLFLKNKIPFAVAHFNFQLRQQESMDDERFVQMWCEQHHIPFYVKTIDTKSYASENKLSIQVAARTLRYDFFHTLLQQEPYDAIATAHHQDDNIETVLFHFFRGTGLRGLTGIPLESPSLIRPLLHVTKKEILQYASKHHITYREDSSNVKVDYTRNKLRNDMIPQLEAIFPAFKQNIAHNIQYLNEAYTVYERQIAQYKKKLIEQRGPDYYIPIRKLKHITPLKTVLYELIKDFHFGFEQAEQLITMMNSQSGKQIENTQFSILKNREFFIITAKKTSESAMILIDKSMDTVTTSDFTLHCKQLITDDYQVQNDTTIAQLNASMLEFPLLLRKWRPGDYMYPLGMKKKKKIARILIDLKIPMHEKDQTWVLESNKKIVWLVGLKTDDRYKITPQTKAFMIINIKK
ncbi:MAG: tRNA lysidine(34) synthetase TilS [Bacteroidetes bacterium]|jgi:tRNA(Ile)-lysidine synthase|nr:tRNA lysidine(34) synthetase TilS [Bacteroidota bacterium]